MYLQMVKKKNICKTKVCQPFTRMGKKENQVNDYNAIMKTKTVNIFLNDS